MADERDEDQFNETEGKGGQQSAGQQSQQGEFGKEQAAQPTGQAGQGSEPPPSMGTKGTEFGQFGDSTGPAGQQGQSGTDQADLGTQADATLAGRTDEQDLGQDQPGSGVGTSGAAGEGFIGQQGTGSDEYVQERESTATEGQNFAPQGRGALEGEQEDIEGGQTRGSGSDIERE